MSDDWKLKKRVPILDRDFILANPDLMYNEWIDMYPGLVKEYGWDKGMGHGEMEDYRVYQRERFLYGKANREGHKMSRMAKWLKIDIHIINFTSLHDKNICFFRN
jgi:hypothetical protein